MKERGSPPSELGLYFARWPESKSRTWHLIIEVSEQGGQLRYLGWDRLCAENVGEDDLFDTFLPPVVWGPRIEEPEVGGGSDAN
jgi:hypothetical protein